MQPRSVEAAAVAAVADPEAEAAVE